MTGSATARRPHASLRRSLPWLAAGALALLLAACEERRPDKAEVPEEEEPPEVQLTRAAFDELPGWRDDSLDKAVPAMLRSCERLLRAPDDRELGPDGRGGTIADWRAPCRQLAGLPDTSDPDSIREVLEAVFVPFQVAGPDGDEGLFTGYYEATLQGARTPGDGYDHPLYRKPGDLIAVNLGDFRAGLDGERIFGRVNDSARLVPYYSRAEIDSGALDGRGLELLWADDPVDVFFLHVQGSGIVRLPDGREQRVGFAASNGRDFTAIGRELIRRDVMDRDDVSMQGIRDWLRENPEEADALMQLNARYIFFREVEAEGPIGAQGVPLTPERSLAIDPRRLPLGAPMWLDTTYPASGEPLRRLMVAQDTGNAIRGTVRGDFFWGPGEPALEIAGRMKQAGRYWLLLPREVAERKTPSG